MTQIKRTNFLVGLFVLVGLAVVAGAIVWLGLASKFDSGMAYSAFFDESVQGLSKDSPVKYRGVSIGRVERISVAADAKLIEVVLKIETDLKPQANMVAQIKSVGITGIMFVELDQREPQEPDLSPKLSFESINPVIATRPSEINQLLGSIDDVLNQLKALDLGGISDRMKTSLETIDRTVAEMEMARLSKQFRDTLSGFNQTMSDISRVADNVENFTAAATSGAAQFERTAASLERVIDGVDRPLKATMGQISQVAMRTEKLIGSVQNENGIAGAVDAFEQVMKNTRQLVDNGSQMLASARRDLNRLQRETHALLQRLETSTILLNESLELIAAQPSQVIFSPAPPDRIIDGQTREER